MTSISIPFLFTALLLLSQVIILAALAAELNIRIQHLPLGDSLRLMLFLSGIIVCVEIPVCLIFFQFKLLNPLRRLANQSSAEFSSDKSEIERIGETIKELRNQISELSQREKIIADYSADLICSIGPDKVIHSINASVMAQLGYNCETLLGRPLATILAATDEIAKLEKALEIAFQKSSSTVELLMLTATEEQKYYSWVFEWSPSNGVFYSIGRDISTEKKLEEANKRDLAVRGLRDCVIAMVTHDLRAPLQTLAAVVDYANDELSNPEGKKMAKIGERNIRHMRLLMDDLLELEKLQTHALPIYPSNFSIIQAMNEAQEIVMASAKEKEITISLEANISPSDMVLADRQRIVQIVSNLLSNAIKFSPRSSIIRIVAQRDQGDLTIRVIDTGRGIPELMLDRIFEPYQQVIPTDSSELGGRGLGLAICKSLVELHRGTIKVNSKEGKGSTFSFTIPLEF